MRKLIVLLLFVLPINSDAQDFISELENSMVRAEGGSGALILYKIHLSSSSVKTLSSTNFDKGELVRVNDVPLYFELSKSNGEDRTKVLITLSEAIHMELSITYPRGNCTYTFDFYY